MIGFFWMTNLGVENLKCQRKLLGDHGVNTTIFFYNHQLLMMSLQPQYLETNITFQIFKLNTKLLNFMWLNLLMKTTFIKVSSIMFGQVLQMEIRSWTQHSMMQKLNWDRQARSVQYSSSSQWVQIFVHKWLSFLFQILDIDILVEISTYILFYIGSRG